MNLGIRELLSYVVTVVGLPLATVVFVLEQRKERLNEQDAVYESISGKYQEFFRVVLEHPDPHLFSMGKTPALTDEQIERMMVIFSMLIALFERAYVLTCDDKLKDGGAASWRGRCCTDYVSDDEILTILDYICRFLPFSMSFHCYLQRLYRLRYDVQHHFLYERPQPVLIRHAMFFSALSTPSYGRRHRL